MGIDKDHRIIYVLIIIFENEPSLYRIKEILEIISYDINVIISRQEYEILFEKM